ncbi:hypothetical protein HYE82_10210 [Streptomyces sp. BR123]|uniref:DUF6461 domain-containing protein n=1 Tax=Streptomyces sp. BR123 TaxID=2749828 RepID=UPI0015C4C17A|nr:DUF6461 domain-containing protein [Streptomyces sp. BR123]NXY94758.1 hypothetical protein [Streptomyces sp. BR123]
MTNTDDYLWFQEDFPDLASAYCITLVHDLPPEELLHRLGGRAEPPRTGAASLVEAWYEAEYQPELTRTLFGMTVIGSWTLMIEPGGWHGVSEAKALPASAGTRWISHCDIGYANSDGTFLWAENGETHLHFELRNSECCELCRSGTRADDCVDVMRRLGFATPEDATPEDEERVIPAAFALAEHLTDVRLTPELFRSTTFVCGSAEV